jgi:drug/metabolite transporter (DMT)-like permease
MHDSAPPEKVSSTPKFAAGSARFAFLAAILGSSLLAFGPWMVRLADVGPVASGFWRLALAAPLLLLIGRAAKQPIPRLPIALWMTLAVGGLFFAADLAAWHGGILRTRLANATLFANITGFTFAIYGFLATRAWPGRNQLVALLLAAIGVGLLLGRSYQLSPEHLVGDLLCLLAGLFYTFYLIALDRTRDQVKPLPALTIATLAGIAPLLLFALATGDPIWPHDWPPLLVLALSSQVVGQGLIVFSVGHLPPVVIGIALLCQPVIASAIGWLAYGETLSTADWIGALAVGVALVLVRWPDRAS